MSTLTKTIAGALAASVLAVALAACAPAAEAPAAAPAAAAESPAAESPAAEKPAAEDPAQAVPAVEESAEPTLRTPCDNGRSDDASGTVERDEDGSIVAYVVAAGDSVWGINNRLCIDDVAERNGINPGQIYPGDRLTLVPRARLR